MENTEKVCEICLNVIASKKQRILKETTFYFVALITRNYLETLKHRNSFFEHPKAFGET